MHWEVGFIMPANSKLLLAAMAGLALGFSTPVLMHADETAPVKCWGINSCGQHASCAVKSDDIAAVEKLLGKTDFQASFGKTTTHSCGHHASCGAASGILNWTQTSESECHEAHGIVIETKDGQKVARKL